MTDQGVVGSLLVLQVGGRLCALGVPDVDEILRPLPLQPPPGVAPPYVLGMAVLRGAVAPVLDLGALLGGGRSQGGRWVSLRVAGRRVALAVDGVVGIRQLGGDAVEGLPPLLDGAGGAVSHLAVVDGALLAILQAARLVPDDAWSLLEAAAGTAP